FEVLEFMLESFFHVSELEDDYYVFDDAKSLLRGRRSGSVFTAGDKITVMLKQVNFITQESAWFLVDVENKHVAEHHKIHERKPFKGKSKKSSSKKQRKPQKSKPKKKR